MQQLLGWNVSQPRLRYGRLKLIFLYDQILSSLDEMFHNLVAADKILISVQKQSQSLNMRRSVVCSIAFFLLAIVSGKAAWSREIPTWSKIEEIERELDKVFHQHHYLHIFKEP